MEQILVSACLLGRPVRYDGSSKTSSAVLLARWRAEGRLVSVCPEVSGGLPVPRPPAEIQGVRSSGEAVLAGAARVVTRGGTDVTEQYVGGAEQALAAARDCGARMAILKEGSPSCGSLQVYDGTFSGRCVAGEGVTTALLRRHGVQVFSECALKEAADYLQTLEEPA